MAEKIPEHLYITAKDETRWDSVTNTHVQDGLPLGFLHAYKEFSSASVKKCRTQHEWAYHSTFVEEDGVFYVREPKYEQLPNGTYRHYSIKEVAKHQPVIILNEPMYGFKVLEFVSRSSTSNKLWRIEDPRGYKFEITCQSFENLIKDVTIVKGVIQEKCVWLRNSWLIASPT